MSCMKTQKDDSMAAGKKYVSEKKEKFKKYKS